MELERSRAVSNVQYPERFELALRYGEGPLQSDASLSTSDKLLLDALSKQAAHGPCMEARPAVRDVVARARWKAWKQLGNRSRMEAMFMYVSAVEEFAPDWWRWPPLGLDGGEGGRTPPSGAAVATTPPAPLANDTDGDADAPPPP
eukprot:305398-Prymnesium_polylepis.1